MKSIKLISVAMLILSSLSCQAWATNTPIHNTSLTTPYNQYEGSYIDLGFGVVRKHFTEDSTASLGTYLNHYLSYELSLTHARGYGHDLFFRTTSTSTTNLIGSAVKAMLPVGNRVTASLKLGIDYELSSGDKTNVTQRTTSSVIGTVISPTIGIGADVAINHQWACGVTYRVVALSSFLFAKPLTTVGATYHF